MEWRTQGSRPRPRTDPLRPRTKDTDASVKKRSLKIVFRRSQEKRSPKFFFRRKRSSKNFFSGDLYLRKSRKVVADFPQGFWRFPIKFQRFKNSAVLEPMTGRRRDLRLEDLRPRSSKCVLEDSTSSKYVPFCNIRACL